VSKTERLLRELIAIPSVNPAFLPPSHPHAGEQRISNYLKSIAERAGLEVELKPVKDGRCNLVARLTPVGKIRKCIVLAPHLDTVNAEDAQFTPSKRNGRIFGRGACDAKGSVAAMFSAVRELGCSAKRPTHTEIVFAGLIDEENAQVGSLALAASGLKADLAIVGEPTRLQAVTAHKGNLWLRLQTRGKSAHGARPELGRNAVHAMARVVHLIETKYAADLRRRKHPLLGCATVSVGVIRGGTQPNIVPDKCVIEIDRRTLPGETESRVRREIQSLLRANDLSANIENGKTILCLPLETNPTVPLVAEFLRNVGQRNPVGVNYYCDASVFSRAGIPSLVFGPGDIAHAHTANEWISVRSLERAREMLLRFLRSLP